MSVFLLQGEVLAQTQVEADGRAVKDALEIMNAHDEAVRDTQDGARKRAFLYPTPRATVTKADLRRFIDGGQARLHGIDIRKEISVPPDRFPYFEGTFKRVYHAFIDQTVVAFAEGVYAIPGEAAYIGNFTYFPQRDEYSGDRVRSVSTRGSYVFVGKRLTWDGQSETGMFIAEDALPGFGLDLLEATPAFLKRFEERHAAAVASQKRRLAQGRSGGGGGGFGAMMALGLGAALIGGSDLSRLDKMDLAESFVTDVAGGGDGMAMFDEAMSQMGVSSGATGVFSGNRVFDAPGLNQAMDGMLNAAVGE